MQEPRKIDELADHVKQYVNTNVELIKLQTIEHASIMGAGVISSIVVGVIGFFCVFFLSLGAGFYLSARSGNTYVGFVEVGVFYLLLVILLTLFRKKMLLNPLRDIIIKTILVDN